MNMTLPIVELILIGLLKNSLVAGQGETTFQASAAAGTSASVIYSTTPSIFGETTFQASAAAGTSASGIYSTTPSIFDLDPSFVVRHAISQVKQVLPEVRNAFPSWHNYTYDGTIYNNHQYQIRNGGNVMFFGWGNQLNFYSRYPAVSRVYYNEHYSVDEFAFETFDGHPFVALAWLKNNHNYNISQLQINSQGSAGARGAGSSVSFSGTILSSGLTVDYYVFQVYDAATPTICHVFFVIHSLQEWNSTRTTSTDNFYHSYHSTGSMYSNLRVQAQNKNVMIGYLLIAKINGTRVNEIEIVNALEPLTRAVKTTVRDVTKDNYDECQSASTNDCDTNAICLNAVGSYECECKYGFFGNGRTCSVESRFAPVHRSLSNIDGVLSSMRAAIPDWYNYTYDGSFSFPNNGKSIQKDIRTGGNNMYRYYGNRVQVHVDGAWHYLNYNELTSVGEQSFASSTGHPFVALLWTNSSTKESFHFRVSGSTGQSEIEGNSSKLTGFISVEDFIVDYHVFQVYGTENPSVCHVHFLVSSPQEWNSTRTKTTQRLSSAYYYSNGYMYSQLYLQEQNVMIGYSLLSKMNGSAVTEDEVRNSLYPLVNRIASLNLPEIDECFNASLNNCDKNAICTNTFESFTCSCPDGFTGNGTFCEELTCSNAECSDDCDVTSSACTCNRACWELGRDHHTCIPSVKTTCINDRIQISVPRCSADRDNVGLDDFVPGVGVPSACLPNITSTHIDFDIVPGQCGSHLEDIENVLKYRASVKMWLENIQTGPDAVASAITRGSWFVIEVSCTQEAFFNVTQSFNPEDVIQNVAIAEGFSPIEISFDIYTDTDFQRSYTTSDYPVSFNLTEVIPFEISITTPDEDVEVSTLSCVALPDPNPANLLPYNMIDDGCLLDETMLTYPTPNPKTNRFSVDAFRFADGLPGIDEATDVFIQCAIVVCVIGDPRSTCSEECVTTTARRRRHVELVENRADDVLDAEHDGDLSQSERIETKAIELPRSGPFIIRNPVEKQDGSGNGAATVSSAVFMILLPLVALTFLI